MHSYMEKFSYSKIDTYVSCPFKYKLKYVDKNFIMVDSVSTAIGSLVHKTEENIAKAIQQGNKVDYISLKNTFILQMYEIANTYKEDFVAKDKSGRTFFDKCYEYLHTTIYNLETFISTTGYEIVGIEQPFEVDYNGNCFKGYIDRVFFDRIKNTFIVQDIKTYPVEVDTQHLATPLQFVIYCLACAKLYDIDFTNIKCQYYLPFCNSTQDAGTDNFIELGKSKLDKIFTNIADSQFAPNPTPLCAWCEYCINNKNTTPEGMVLCPYHSEWTKEKKSFKVANKWEGLEQNEIICAIYKKELGVH